MDPLTAALMGGGAGLGLLKGLLIDGPQAEQQNKINAAVTRYSPWTGMKGDTTKHNANTLGDMLTGGLMGAMAGKSGLFAAAKPETDALATGATALTQTQPTWATLLQKSFLNPDAGQYGMRGLSLLGGP